MAFSKQQKGTFENNRLNKPKKQTISINKNKFVKRKLKTRPKMVVNPVTAKSISMSNLVGNIERTGKCRYYKIVNQMTYTYVDLQQGST